MVNYPSCVDKINIKIDEEKIGNEKFRYSLVLPLKSDENNNLLVIMMNPAEATEIVSDLTINRVIEYIIKNKKLYSTLIIANLYPVYEQYSKLLKLHEDQYNLNITKLINLIEKNKNILIGWGRPDKSNQKILYDIKYHHIAREVVSKMIESNSIAYNIGDLRENLYPKHLGRIGYEYNMDKCDLTKLKDKLDLQLKRNNKRFNLI